MPSTIMTTTNEPSSRNQGLQRRISQFFTTTCQRCHHYHKNSKINFTIDERDGLQTDWKCEHCRFKPWNFGRRRTTLSLASQHTISDMKDFYNAHSRKMRFGESSPLHSRLRANRSEHEASGHPSTVQIPSETSPSVPHDQVNDTSTLRETERKGNRRYTTRFRSLKLKNLWIKFRSRISRHRSRPADLTQRDIADEYPNDAVNEVHSQENSQLHPGRQEANNSPISDRVSDNQAADQSNDDQADTDGESLEGYRDRRTPHTLMTMGNWTRSLEILPHPPGTPHPRALRDSRGSGILAGVNGAGPTPSTRPSSIAISEPNRSQIHLQHQSAHRRFLEVTGGNRRGSDNSHNSLQSDARTLVNSTSSSSMSQPVSTSRSDLSSRISIESTIQNQDSAHSLSPVRNSRSSYPHHQSTDDLPSSLDEIGPRDANGEATPAVASQHHIHTVQEDDELRLSEPSVVDFATNTPPQRQSA